MKRMHEVFGIIDGLKRQRGISFLVVEHRVKEISKITDRWIGLKLGKKMYDDVSIEQHDLNRVFL